MCICVVLVTISISINLCEILQIGGIDFFFRYTLHRRRPFMPLPVVFFFPPPAVTRGGDTCVHEYR